MSACELWQVNVRTTPDAEASISRIMEEFFAMAPCTYIDQDSQAVDVAVYLSRKKDCSPTRLARLSRKLDSLGCSTPARLSVKRLRRQDWGESWKRHFKPLEIRRRLLIKPSWSRRRPKRGQEVVILDPGLSFGTGHHPTTAYCLEQLVRARRNGHRQSCLDIGTGSGLLAIAAAKLGYAPVRACDNDVAAVRIARQNAALNEVSSCISTTRRDLATMGFRRGTRFDVVCANLMADLLILESRTITRCVAPEGQLLLAGILAREFEAVRLAYLQQGLRLIRSRKNGGWRSGVFAA
jgi:ribosomal protein L11 methyltransferase